jgi:inhibitor of KinA sporulation pathway (predicted exonuclease)
VTSCVVFDLEYTAWEGSMATRWTRPGEYKEIVQIGAVRLDDDWQEEAALSLFIRPRINPQLSDYFINLTGITQARMDEEGMDLVQAMEKFGEFIGPSLIAYCNGCDEVVLVDNCRLFDIAPPPYLSRLCDIHGHFLADSGLTSDKLFSFRLHQAYGLESGGHQAHDGLGDARAIAAVLTHLHSLGRFPPRK